MIGVGGYFSQEATEEMYPKEELAYLYENFVFLGKEPEYIFLQNLRMTIEKIGTKTHIILIKGIDLDVSDWIGKERVEINLKMNAVVDQIIEEYDNVDLVDMRHIVTKRSQLVKHDNRHFDRATYYRMADKIKELSEVELNLNNPLVVELQSLTKKAVRKIRRILSFLNKR